MHEQRRTHSATVRTDAPLDVGPFAHGGLIPTGPNGPTPLEVPNALTPSITVNVTPSSLTTTNGAPDDEPHAPGRTPIRAHRRT